MVEKKILKSKEILPTKDRIKELYSNDDTDIDCLHAWENKYGQFEDAVYLIDKYHKALEAVEQELLELKFLNADLCNESRVLKFEAKERYKKALVYYGDTTIENRDIIHTLKIAAGI